MLQESGVETRVFKTSLKNGICQTVVKPDAIIDLADAMENTNIVEGLSNGNLYPLLVDVRKIKSISKEARNHFSMRNRQPGVKAIAMLVKSPVSRVIGYFFVSLNKPNVPFRLFTSEEKAMKWLEQFIPA